MKINTEVLGKIGSAMVTAGQTIDPDAVGFDFGTLKKKKKALIVISIGELYLKKK